FGSLLLEFNDAPIKKGLAYFTVQFILIFVERRYVDSGNLKGNLRHFGLLRGLAAHVELGQVTLVGLFDCVPCTQCDEVALLDQGVIFSSQGSALRKG